MVIPIQAAKVLPFNCAKSPEFLFLERPISQESKWTASFDGHPIYIMADVPNTFSIDHIRIFNSPESEGTSVKDIEIYVGDNLMWNGEIPISFGLIAHLEMKNKKLVIEEPDSWKKSFALIDKFGKIPQYTGNTISIKFLSNYGDQNFIGFYKVMFCDVKNKPIPISQIQTKIIEGVCEGDPTDCLLDKSWYNEDDSKFSLFKLVNFSENTNHPLIQYTFDNTIVGSVCIFNPTINQTYYSSAVKNFEVIIDNKNIIYVGKAKKGAETIESSKTTVFINENKKN